MRALGWVRERVGVGVTIGRRCVLLMPVPSCLFCVRVRAYQSEMCVSETVCLCVRVRDT
jgi:hypothetical protein